MSVTEVGPQPNNPEIAPFTPDPRAVALHNALTGEDTWPKSHEAQRQSFMNIIEGACSTVVNPDLQQAIRLVGQDVQWRLYARPGETLPDHRILIKSPMNNCVRIDWHPDSPVRDSQAYRIIERYLMPHGLSDRLAANARDRLCWPELIHSTVVDIIKSSEAYQFLASFAVDAPEPAEQQLPQFWRQIREAQNEVTIRDRFAITEGQPIPPHSAADHARRRSLQQLDEETMPKRASASKPEDGFSRFRAHVAQQVCEPGETIAWPSPGSEKTEAWIEDAEGDLWDMADVIWSNSPGSPVKDIHNGLTILDDFDSAYANYFACEIFNTQSNPQNLNYGDYLEEYTNMYVTQMLKQQDKLSLGASELDWEIDYYGSGLAWRKQVIAPVYDWASTPVKDSSVAGIRSILEEARDSERVLNINRNTYERDRAIQVGYVLEHLSKIVPSQARRLIQTQQFRQLPSIDPKHPNQLVVEFEEDTFKEHTMPFIPGYTTIARNSYFKETFAFTPNTDHDPYQPCGAPLDASQLKHLATIYSLIGLDPLVEAIDSGRVKTVDDLAQTLARQSIYSFDWKHLDNPQGIEDFEPMIENGRLNFQCNGAANFLRLSLDRIFGKGSAATVTGYVLPPHKSTINGAGHAQTSFTYRGKAYILDATPARADIDNRDGEEDEYVNRRQAPVPPHSTEEPQSAPKPDKFKVSAATHETPTTSVEEVIKQSKEQSLAALRQSLEAQLQVILEQPNADKLYEFVNKLPESNPIRRTVSATLRATSDTNISLEELENLSSYLHAYQQASKHDLRRAKLTEYKPGVLNTLSHTAQKLLELS